MIWILLGMIFIWAILLITSMVVAENGNKKAFTYLFSGCIGMVFIIMVFSLWMIYKSN